MGKNLFIKGKLSGILSNLNMEEKTHDEIAKMLIGLPFNQEIGKIRSKRSEKLLLSTF